MRTIIKADYLRRVRKILNSKRNRINIITSINSRAISIIRYSAGVLKWPVAEVKELDRKTRKQLTMHGAHYPKSNTERLYMKRSIGGRGLISVEDCIESESNSLQQYLRDSQEPLLQAGQKMKWEVSLILKRNMLNNIEKNVFMDSFKKPLMIWEEKNLGNG